MRRGGMTLMEVLVAIALITALTGAMIGFLHDMLSARLGALELIATERSAATVIDTLERRLAASLAGDARVGAGVRGDERSIRILSRQVAVSLAERGGDDPAVFGDLLETEIRFDPARRVVEARQGVPGDAAGSTFVSLGGTVGRMRLRYLDGSSWRNDFDSLAAGRLPLAIEIAIWFDEVEPPAPDGAGDAAADAPGPGDIDADALPETGAVERPPDRLQVIAVPDAAAPDEEDGR